jgi:hypothetical protein
MIIFGLMTMLVHFVIVTLQLTEKIPIVGWISFILNLVLIPLRVMLAILTDKFHPEGQMRAKIISLTTNASEKEAQEIINIYNEQDNVNTKDEEELAGVDRIKYLSGDIIDDILSTDKHTRIYENYYEFKEALSENFDIIEHDEAFTIIVSRHKSTYKISVIKEENTFSAYWEIATINDMTSHYKQDTETYKYDDVEFDESDFNVAIQRSMLDNNEWIYLHTNLKGAIEFLKVDGWKYFNDGIYLYPIALDNGKYKKIELGYDDNNFPVVRADSVNTYNEAEIAV